MLPILISIGPLHLYSYSVFMVAAWLVFSYVFWKRLRSCAISDERIFDLTFYGSVVGILVSRLVFVVFHLNLFADNFLKVVVLWVQSGLSLYGLLIAGFATCVVLCRSYKVRLAYVLDAIAVAFPFALIVGEIGAILDGTFIGKTTSLPWGVLYVGHLGHRHPVQIYEFISLVVIVAIIMVMERRAEAKKWPYGVLGVWFFLLYSMVFFSLEFLRDGSIYWTSLSASQWVLVGLFSEAVGALYVRGGGKEKLASVAHKLRNIVKIIQGGIYDKFGKRHTG